MKILIVLLFSVCGFAVLRLLNAIAIRLPQKYTLLKKSSRYLPLIELTFWVAFVFWVVDYLFSEKSYHEFLVVSLVTVVLALISWFWLKDFIAGVIAKVQHQFKVGQHLTLDTLEGKILSIKMTYLTIETEDGQKQNVPFTLISQGVITEHIKTETQDRFKFRIDVPKSYQKDQFVDQSKKAIFNSPWSISKKMPVVELIEEHSDFNTFEFKLQGFNARHIGYIENRIRRQLLSD